MKNPRILITTYHQAFLTKGGGEYELLFLADSLKQRGFIVDIYGPYSCQLSYYDLVLHFSVHAGGIEILKEVKAAGKPIVIWPNFWILPGQPVPVELMQEHVAFADLVIFKSQAEKKHFEAHVPIPASKVRCTSVVADSKYKSVAPEGLFKALYGVDNYAISLGIIEPKKNQLASIRALKKKKVPLVLVGRHRDEEYYAACKSEGVDHVIFIEGLPPKSEILRSALQNSLFYIELSHEPPGLSAIEAGLSGCRLLLSDSEWSREYFKDFAVYAKEDDENSIAYAIDDVLSRSRNQGELVKEMDRFCLPNSLDPLIDSLKELVL